MMLTKIDEIYDLCIQVLPSSDRVRLATLLLNDFVQEGAAVIYESDTWTEEDIADLSNFSLQYAATIYPDGELIEDEGLYNSMMEVKDETPLSLEEALAIL